MVFVRHHNDIVLGLLFVALLLLRSITSFLYYHYNTSLRHHDKCRDLTTSTLTKLQGSSSSILQVVARSDFSSDPVRLCSDRDDLLHFFQNPNNRNHLLLGSGTSTKESRSRQTPGVKPILSASSELWDRWKMESSRTGATTLPPDPQVDQMVIVKASEISFPLGMKLLVESIVGVKLVLMDNHGLSEFPEYQFTLIQDNVHAEGPKPLVWLYNQIMKTQRSRQNEGKQMTHSCSILQMKEVDNTTDDANDDDTKTYAIFIYSAEIEINVEIPKFLVKLLPMSQEQCNQQGSAAIQKTFQTMGKPSLDNFVTAYKAWLLK